MTLCIILHISCLKITSLVKNASDFGQVSVFIKLDLEAVVVRFFSGQILEREERRVGNCNALLWLLFFPQVPQPIAMKEITVAMQNKTKPDIRMSSKKTPKRALHAISLELQHIYFPWQNCQGPSHLPLIIT